MTSMANTLANNVWGVILARYVTPILVAITLGAGSWIGGQVIKEISTASTAISNLRADLARQDNRITAIESRRDATSKARDDQIAQILDIQERTTDRLDVVVQQLAGVAAKVEVLIDRQVP